MMIDGIPNRPLYFYQKDTIDDRGVHTLGGDIPEQLR